MTTDEELRKYALALAVNSATPARLPDNIVQDAQKYYDFLKGITK